MCESVVLKVLGTRLLCLSGMKGVANENGGTPSISYECEVTPIPEIALVRGADLVLGTAVRLLSGALEEQHSMRFAETGAQSIK
jgi:hypothetical protein